MASKKKKEQETELTGRGQIYASVDRAEVPDAMRRLAGMEVDVTTEGSQAHHHRSVSVYMVHVRPVGTEDPWTLIGAKAIKFADEAVRAAFLLRLVAKHPLPSDHPRHPEFVAKLAAAVCANFHPGKSDGPWLDGMHPGIVTVPTADSQPAGNA